MGVECKVFVFGPSSHPTDPNCKQHGVASNIYNSNFWVLDLSIIGVKCSIIFLRHLYIYRYICISFGFFSLVISVTTVYQIALSLSMYRVENRNDFTDTAGDVECWMQNTECIFCLGFFRFNFMSVVCFIWPCAQQQRQQLPWSLKFLGRTKNKYKWK